MPDMTNKKVQIQITGGPDITVPWFSGMNAQQAMEAAYNASSSNFTYLLQYYGSGLGYLVTMINETYETFPAASSYSYEPFFYWAFLVNGQPSQTGIDSTVLKAGDVVTFSFEMYNASEHQNSTVQFKHDYCLGKGKKEKVLA